MDTEKRKKKLVDVYWWEGLPWLLGIFVPNILEPSWFWRMLFTFWAALGLTILLIRMLIEPRLMFQKGVDPNKKPKILKVIGYAIGVLGIVIGIFFALIPISIDIFGWITKTDWLKTSVVEIQDTHYSGSAPFFLGRSVDVVINGEQKTYYLIFYARPLPSGTYTLIHSPTTYFIWDVLKKIN